MKKASGQKQRQKQKLMGKRNVVMSMADREARNQVQLPFKPLPMTYNPPSSKRVTLVFAEQAQIIEGAAGTGGFLFFRLNSAYDVDTSVASTSTPGFAEWTGFFSNYRVWKTRVRVEGSVYNLSSSGAIGTVALVPNPLQATLPSSAVSWPVQKGAVHMTVNNVTSGGTNFVVLDKQYSLPAVFRITENQYKDEFDFSASVTANPARQAYVAVTLKTFANSVIGGFTFQIYVSMEVEFFNNVLLAT